MENNLDREITNKDGSIKEEFVDLMEDKGPECSILCKVLSSKSMMILNSNNIDRNFFVNFSYKITIYYCRIIRSFSNNSPGSICIFTSSFL